MTTRQILESSFVLANLRECDASPSMMWIRMQEDRIAAEEACASIGEKLEQRVLGEF